ncbi:MAG: LLM class flavin-dependent oxidoreductase [Ardenticatenaceae bacterium]
MIKNRYGISMGVSPREPLTRVSKIATAVDDYGFDALWFIDFQLGMKDVYAALNMAALASQNLQLGSAVTNLTTRHPTVTANAINAVDELSDGRAMLGVGAGWSAVLGAGGKPSKLREMRQGISEFRELFTGEEADLYGTTIRLATARRQIPMYLAVSQPGMLRLSGEVCDGAIVMGAADPEFYEWQLQYIYEGLEKAGRSRDELTIDLFITMSVNEDEEQALSDVSAWATSQAATFYPWKRMPEKWERFRPDFKRAADAYHLVDHLSLRAEHKAIVSEEFVRSVTLVGNRETCIQRLKALRALDVDRITIALLSGGRFRRLEQLATDILPAVDA